MIDFHLIRPGLAAPTLCAVMLAGALCIGNVARAQESAARGSVVQPLPLSGAAYRVAQQAYDAFSRRDYTTSATQAREAIRQRPDVVELRLLLANALAASRRYSDASRSLGEAIAQIGPDRALVARRKQIDALKVSTRAVARNRPRTVAGANAANTADADGNLAGPVLLTAQKAYKAYADKDFAGAVKFANEAIALRPDVLRLRLLLVDAASADGQDTVAWDADMDAKKRFGDNEELDLRRAFIGNRLAPKVAGDALAARRKGDLTQAVSLMRQAVAYAPDRIDYRIQLFDGLLAANDLPDVEAAASDAIAYDDTEIMPFEFRGYARAAQGRFDESDADLDRALKQEDATRRNQRVVRAMIADVWIAEGKSQRALDMLKPLKNVGDDTDPLISLRRAAAAAQLQQGSSATPAADVIAQRVATNARPVIDCNLDEFGAACDVYAFDPGFTAARASARATDSGDKKGAVKFARDAVAAAPRDARHRVELINALTNAGDDDGATQEARRLMKDRLLDALPPLSAAYIAQRAGANRVAFDNFKKADASGKLPADTTADAGFAAIQAHRNKDAAAYLERAIDASTKGGNSDDSGNATTAAAPQQLYDMRTAHADVTRNWGFDVSLNYRGSGLQPGFSSTAPGTSNNWQAGTEVYWRPFGSLGDRMFEVYARGYENFGVKNGGATGIDTLQAVLGARAKPFADIDAIVAFEHIFPIGSSVNNDWLGRLAYSGGVGTERRVDVPSWWTAQVYAETGHYLNADTTYATTSLEVGRTYRMDRVSPRWTVFPYAVIGANYDTAVDHSWPLGAGVGVSTRYWFRDGKYDAPRSFVDLSVQYRWRITGDDRARGMFFGAIYSY
jgi:Bacteriophage N adsorption protein A C-term